jgi:prevent-host-death family protein
MKRYIDLVRDGEEIVITDRGVPTARLTPVDSTSLLDELARRGVIGPPARRARRSARSIRRVRATGSVAELVGGQRR